MKKALVCGFAVICGLFLLGMNMDDTLEAEGGDKMGSNAETYAFWLHNDGDFRVNQDSGVLNLGEVSTVDDHGDLTGNADDDHSQYLTTGRHGVSTTHTSGFNNNMPISGDADGKTTQGAHNANGVVHWPRQAQTLTVAEFGSGEFSTIAAALSVANANASVSNPYEIAIYPGLYLEDNLIVESYVSLRSVISGQAEIRGSTADPVLNLRGNHVIVGLEVVNNSSGDSLFCDTGASTIVMIDSVIEGGSNALNYNGKAVQVTASGCDFGTAGGPIISGKTFGGFIKAHNCTFIGFQISSMIDIDASLSGNPDLFDSCFFSVLDFPGSSNPAFVIDFDAEDLVIRNCRFDISATTGNTMSAIMIRSGTARVQGCEFVWSNVSGTPYDFNAAATGTIKHADTVYDVAKTTGAGTISPLNLGKGLYDSLTIINDLSVDEITVSGATILDTLTVINQSTLDDTDIVGDLDVTGPIVATFSATDPITAVRASSTVDSVEGALAVEKFLTGEALDGAGPSIGFYLQDDDAVRNLIARIEAFRVDGLDDAGGMRLRGGSSGLTTFFEFEGDGGGTVLPWATGETTGLRFGDGDGEVYDGVDGIVIDDDTVAVKLGDTGGAEEFQIFDSADVKQAWIDSNGKIFTPRIVNKTDTNTFIDFSVILDMIEGVAGNVSFWKADENGTQDVFTINDDFVDMDTVINWDGGRALFVDGETGIVTLDEGLPATEVSLRGGANVQTFLDATQSTFTFRSPNVTENALLDGTIDIGPSAWFINSNGNKTVISLASVSALPLAAGLNWLCGDWNERGPFAITVANTATETFTMAGDVSEWFSFASKFVVSGSTGNDATWTTASVVFTGGNTEVTVTGDITDATADGNIDTLPRYVAVTTEPDHLGRSNFALMWKNGSDHLYEVGPVGHQFLDFTWRTQKTFLDLFGLFRSSGTVTTESGATDLALSITSGILRSGINELSFSSFDSGTEDTITAVNTGTPSFTVAGDVTALIDHGWLITVQGSTANNGAYTVESATFGAGSTVIVTEQAIGDATVDGHIHIETMPHWYFDFSSSQWVMTNQAGDDGSPFLDNVYFNDITASPAFVALQNNSRYAVHYIFAIPDDRVHVVYGQGDFALAEAQAADVPADLPPLLADVGIYVAKVIVQKNATDFAEVFIPAAGAGAGAGGSVAGIHDQLGDISGGAPGDFFHVTEAQHISLTNSLLVTEDVDGKTVSITERGITQTNTGAVGGGVWNLPEASTWIGEEITGAVVAAQNMDWNPDAADIILGFTDAAGDALRSSTPGDSVVFEALDATNILARPIGTWSDVN